MNILLIRPNESLHGAGHVFTHFKNFKFIGSKVLMPPLELATLAALTPPGHYVRIWDEAADGDITSSTDLGKSFDVIGITGYINHLKRMAELLPLLRGLQPGATIVGGGSGLSASPIREDLALDVVFIGEAEATWARFLADHAQGKALKRYKQAQPVNMESSPTPAWHLIPNIASRYLLGPVQTSRGCPFECEFCDVSSLFGRTPRHKSIDQVLTELRALHALGFENIGFCDDNFYGNKKYAKSLLRAIIELNGSFKKPLLLSSQITLDIAKSDETLTLLADANFNSVFIGIESPNTESLVEANKPQNYRTNMISDIRKIQSYGISVRAGIIVGFDHDDERIFQQQKQFLQDACVSTQAVNILEALPNTALWKRLDKEGRIRTPTESGLLSHSWSVTNIVPKRMMLDRLVDGFCDLMEDLARWDSFGHRMRGMIDSVNRRPNAKLRTGSLRQVWQFFWFVLFQADAQARATIVSLYAHTLLRAPFMLRTLTEQVVYHLAFARETEALSGAIKSRDRASASRYHSAKSSTKTVQLSAT